jgi:hypothetical protein
MSHQIKKADPTIIVTATIICLMRPVKSGFNFDIINRQDITILPPETGLLGRKSGREGEKEED